MARLRSAQLYFDNATKKNPDREDSVCYGSAIEVVIGFANCASSEDSQIIAERIKVSATKWLAWREQELMPEWLCGREDFGVQLFQLVSEVQAVSAKLSRPSWLNASAVLEQVLAVYSAQRTVAPGLSIVLQPPIESAFVQLEGLRAHLDDALATATLNSVSRDIAQNLREKIRKVSERERSPGKVNGEGRFPRLTAVLEDQSFVESLPLEAATHLEMLLRSHTLAGAEVAHPIIQQLLRNINQGVSNSPYFAGEIRLEFEAIAIQILVFCKDRLDATRRQRGPRGRYLQDPSATEWDLQSDLREFLAGNCLWADVQTEIDGVATGRADVYVTAASFRRYIIELKRETEDASPSGLERYLPQTLSYQVTNIPLGILGVLDLTQQGRPASHLSLNAWSAFHSPGSGDTRHVMVFRVPGNLVLPSSASD